MKCCLSSSLSHFPLVMSVMSITAVVQTQQPWMQPRYHRPLCQTLLHAPRDCFAPSAATTLPCIPARILLPGMSPCPTRTPLPPGAGWHRDTRGSGQGLMLCPQFCWGWTQCRVREGCHGVCVVTIVAPPALWQPQAAGTGSCTAAPGPSICSLPRDTLGSERN